MRDTGPWHRSVTHKNRAPTAFLYPLTRDFSQGAPNPGCCMNGCLFSVPQLELKGAPLLCQQQGGMSGSTSIPSSLLP